MLPIQRWARLSAADAVVAAEAAVGVGAACVAPDAATGTVGSGVLTCAAAEEADVSATVEAAVAALLSRTCHQKVNTLSSYMSHVCVFFLIENNEVAFISLVGHGKADQVKGFSISHIHSAHIKNSIIVMGKEEMLACQHLFFPHNYFYLA